MPSVLPETAAYKYSPAIWEHQVGSHDCRLDAAIFADRIIPPALLSADQLPIQLPLN
jgi:hypothetical protein